MSQLTLFRSVNAKIVEGLAKMEETGELGKLIGIGGVIGKEWATLRQLVLERAICKSLAVRALRNEERQCREVCSIAYSILSELIVSQCGGTFRAFELLYCARCRMVTYCSKGCQKNAWKRPGKAHRSECERLEIRRKNQGEMNSSN